MDLYVPGGHQPGASLSPAELQTDSFSLLKIDVEGAELGVFKGAERILRQHRPLLVFESENRQLAPGKVQDVFSFLEGLGYAGSFVCRDQLLRSRNSTRPSTSARTANGSGRAETIATILSSVTARRIRRRPPSPGTARPVDRARPGGSRRLRWD
jgi:hypothetical protein